MKALGDAHFRLQTSVVLEFLVRILAAGVELGRLIEAVVVTL